MLSALINPDKLTKAKHILFLFAVLLLQLKAFAQSTVDEQLAAQYYQNKEFDKALDYYEKLYKKQEGFYPQYLNCLLQLQDFKTAEKTVKKQVKKYPEKLVFMVDLGTVYQKDGETSKADGAWKDAVKSIKKDDQVFEAAKAFVEIRQYDFAVETYLRGRKISLNNYLYSFELAKVYEAKGDKLSMINEYLGALEEEPAYIQAVQNELQTSFGSDADAEQNDLLRTELLRRIAKRPDKTIFSELLIWMQIQQKDFEGAFVQAKALDRRNNENGDRLMSLAELSAENKAYDVAKKAYQYVIDKGDDNFNYVFARMQFLNVSYQKITQQLNYTFEELTELEKNYLSTLDELGKTAATVAHLKNLAHLQAFYLNRPKDAISLLESAVDLPRVSQKVQAELKLELADILLASGDIWEASLRYSQVEKTFKYDAIGQEAKFRNAKVAFYTGNFKWAQAQLDVLKGATAKLISNDAMDLSILISDAFAIDTNEAPLQIYARAELLSFQNKTQEALTTLDSINALFPNHALADEVLYEKALIYLKLFKFEQSAEMFQEIITNHGFDILADDAMFNLALLNEEQFKNLEKAKELYKELMEKHPDSLYVVEARNRFRALRGDKIN